MKSQIRAGNNPRQLRLKAGKVVNSYPTNVQSKEEEREFIRRIFRGDYRMAAKARALLTQSRLTSIRFPTVLVCMKGDPRIDRSLVIYHETTQ